MFRARRLVLSTAKNRAAGLSDLATSSSSQRLAGKVAVITGAASGIGKVTAAEFIRNGAKVVLADVQDELGRAAAAELGPDAAYVHCDVTDEAQVAGAVDHAVARHGRLDVMFNNAGITGHYAGSPVESLDLADFDRVMSVNLRGVAAGIKHARSARECVTSDEELRRILEEDFNEMDGAVLRAEDVARVAVFLASDDANVLRQWA